MEPTDQYDKKEDSDNLPIFRNIFLPIWIRRFIQARNGVDRLLLDYGWNFLPVVGVISWLLFFIIQR
jgi:hypothetical protein